MNPAGIEPATELLSSYGIDSLMIDEEGDFKDFLENNHQYWDYVDEDLMQSMHGKSRITFYLEDSEEGLQYPCAVPHRPCGLQKAAPRVCSLILSMENVEDADWENNWKQFYKPVEIGERLLVVPEWEQAEGGRARQAHLKPRSHLRHRQPRDDAPLPASAGKAYPRRGKGARPRLRQRHLVHCGAAARREGRLRLRH